MRRAVLLIVLGLALATPAGAQPRGKLVAATPAKAALRGPLTAGTPSAPPAVALPLSQPLPAYGVSTAATAQDPGQCRLACAQRYYFCLAGDAPDDCPPTWGQCRAACDAPSPVRAAQAEFPG